MNRIEKIVKMIRKEEPEVLLRTEEEGQFPVLRVERDRVVPVLRLLRDDFGFESLMCETASDRGDRIDLIYHLFSTPHRETLVVKTVLSREKPQVETAEDVWKSANWYEREIFDLFGVEFIGHSDLVRILLPQDWGGHHMRKDYRPAPEYHGMKIEY